MSFDKAPDESSCKALCCVIMAITAVLMIAAVIDDNVVLYEPICCFPCCGVYLRQPQRPRRLQMPSGPASPP